MTEKGWRSAGAWVTESERECQTGVTESVGGCAVQSDWSSHYSSASFPVTTLLSFSSVARETAAGSSCCRGDILRDPAILSAQ